jgi:hypothetical protein
MMRLMVPESLWGLGEYDWLDQNLDRSLDTQTDEKEV